MSKMLEHLDQNNTLAALAGLSLILTGAVAVSTDYFETSLVEDMDESSVQWKNEITVEKNGQEIAEFTNTLTDQGKNYIRSQLSDVGTDPGNESANITYISVGNGSTVQTGDTVLDKEVTCCGLERTSGSVTTFSAGEFQVKNTFTASADVGTVNTTGLNYDGSNGANTLVSGGSFSADANLLTDDQLTVTHNITISEGSN